MYLLLSILLSTVLGFVLLMLGPLYGGLIAFGIVLGCIFKGLYLLNDIHSRISKILPKGDRVQEVYKKYLEEKEQNSL
ncbi:hypothetical protein [Metabacillus niabensis]|uniref:ATP-dependent Lon protease n=1 Tax=Metabacillus niabensis TaxID=324854 RepID=A0ABT9Z6Q5_9BACI|nr:hypothetical protein [Metabacillus niabensis]MDQ0227941.1 hypothetical protein [Metabacillus niabensis]